MNTPEKVGDTEQAISAVPVANGYSFVVESANDGSEEGYVPARIFTEHFSKRQIPIAPPGSYLYQHDMQHVPGYLDIFSNALFADTVARAASNALVGRSEALIEKQCADFTRSIDTFSGMHSLLTQDFRNSRQTKTYDVVGAKYHLAQLVEQAYGSHPLASSEGRAAPGKYAAHAAYSTLCASLRLHVFESVAMSELDVVQTGSVVFRSLTTDLINFEE